MDKAEQIKHLNSEVLFSSRKNFGMSGNVQFAVEDIKDNCLVIRACSNRNDIGELKSDGSKVPSQGDIMLNIEKSVRSAVGDKYEGIEVYWDDWKEGDGYGFTAELKQD